MKTIVNWLLILIIAQVINFSCTPTTKSPISHLPFKDKENNKWGVISSAGKIVVTDLYSNLPYCATENIYIVQRDNGKYEYYKIDPTPFKIGATYLKAAAFSESLAPVIEEMDYISVIDSKGNTVFTIEQFMGKRIVSCSTFSNGVAIIETEDDLMGYIDKNGKIIIEPQYIRAFPFNDGYAVVQRTKDQGGEWYLINKEGSSIINLGRDITNSTGVVTSGLLALSTASDNDIWHFISIKKNIIATPASRDYVEVLPVENSMFRFYDGSKWGVANLNGDKIIQAKYDYIEHSGKGHFIVKRGDVWYIIDNKEKECGNNDFVDHTGNINGNIFIKLRDKYILIDSKGSRVNKEEYAHVKLNIPPDKVTIELFNYRRSLTSLLQNIKPGMLYNYAIGTSASHMVKMLGGGEAESLKGQKRLSSKRAVADLDATFTLFFNADISTAITERTMLRNIWGKTYWDNVIIGYNFNDNSHLQEISVTITPHQQLKGKERELAKALMEIALTNGFSVQTQRDSYIQLSTHDGSIMNINFNSDFGIC